MYMWPWEWSVYVEIGFCIYTYICDVFEPRSQQIEGNKIMSESSVVSQLPDEKLKLEGGNDSASPFDSSVVVDAAAEESISLVDNENPYNWSTKKSL